MRRIGIGTTVIASIGYLHYSASIRADLENQRIMEEYRQVLEKELMRTGGEENVRTEWFRRRLEIHQKFNPWGLGWPPRFIMYDDW